MFENPESGCSQETIGEGKTASDRASAPTRPILALSGSLSTTHIPSGSRTRFIAWNSDNVSFVDRGLNPVTAFSARAKIPAILLSISPTSFATATDIFSPFLGSMMLPTAACASNRLTAVPGKIHRPLEDMIVPLYGPLSLRGASYEHCFLLNQHQRFLVNNAGAYQFYSFINERFQLQWQYLH